MATLTFDQWKQQVISYLNDEISRRVLDKVLTGDIQVVRYPGRIFRDQGVEISESSDEAVIISSIPDSTEIVDPFHLRIQINAPFGIWHEDGTRYDQYLKRFTTDISNKINTYMIQKLSEEAQSFTIENDSITFEDILSTLSDLSYYPDTILLNTLKCWSFIKDEFITINRGDSNYISNFGNINICDSRLLEENEILLLLKEDIMMQKDEMSIQFYPNVRSRELYINEDRVIWAYNNRGLGHLSSSN